MAGLFRLCAAAVAIGLPGCLILYCVQSRAPARLLIGGAAGGLAGGIGGFLLAVLDLSCAKGMDLSPGMGILLGAIVCVGIVGACEGVAVALYRGGSRAERSRLLPGLLAPLAAVLVGTIGELFIASAELSPWDVWEARARLHLPLIVLAFLALAISLAAARVAELRGHRP
jgi:hypothetical protein